MKKPEKSVMENEVVFIFMTQLKGSVTGVLKLNRYFFVY